MPHLRIPSLAVSLLALLAASWPVSSQGDPCTRFRGVEIPVADLPTPADRTRLVGCVSEPLYYAEKPAAAGLRDARFCAFLEREAEEPPVFGGAAVLMMIYANGRGVPVNYELARRFACEVEGAPAELEGRLEHLAALAAAKGGETFDLCDDITSGYMMGFCANREADIALARQEAELSRMIAGWQPAKREAFTSLRAAATAYFEARVSGEVDASGTARGALQVEEEMALEKSFFEALKAFEAGHYPQGDAATLAAADAELNRVYGALLKAAKPDSPEDTFGPFGTVVPKGIRDTERLWIPYRDAWARFGKIFYPKAAPEAWLSWQTTERTRLLREMLGEEE